MRRCKNSGFTLIEVLVAVTILGLISVLLWQGMGTSVASKERFEKEDESFHAASLALSRISQELQMAVLFSSIDMLGVSPSGEQNLKSVFIGKNNGDQDKLTFNTLAHIRHYKDAKESDLAEVAYGLEPDPAGEGTFLLKKREQSPPDNKPDEGGHEAILLKGVVELNFRYYDPVKQEFVDEWDSTSADYLNRLPPVVEIDLKVRDPLDPEGSHKFTTYASLPMAPGPNDF